MTHTLALIKPSGQRYVFRCDRESVERLKCVMARATLDEDTDFDWQDFVYLASELGRQVRERGRTVRR